MVNTHSHKTMGNHTEILGKIADRLRGFEQAGGDVEEDLWPSAAEVLREIREMIESADPPVLKETS